MTKPIEDFVNKIIEGDCLEVLKTMPDNSIDSIVTDPPYGLGKEPDIREVMKAWIDKGYHEITGSGFMNKSWDAFVPQPIVWQEVYRVLKPGGYALVSCGTRTQDWMASSLRFAGFEIRDILAWAYGSGFPKSLSIDKQLIKNGFIKEAKELKMSGTAIKPAIELWTLCRKPLGEKSVAENVLKYGTGGINIDGCRIQGEYKCDGGKPGFTQDKGWNQNNMQRLGERLTSGRFPANLILSHSPECKCIGTKKIKSNGHFTTNRTMNKVYAGGWKNTGIDEGNKLADEDGNETMENWECVEDCPIRIMDEQSGHLKSGTDCVRTQIGSFLEHGSLGKVGDVQVTYGDSGGASRFFKHCDFEDEDVLFAEANHLFYCAKASKSERDIGLETFNEKEVSLNTGEAHNVAMLGRETRYKNNHPTVKPLKLMKYLCRLITPPNGIVLDPYTGSGSTGVSAKAEGFRFIGIESDKSYIDIANARFGNVQKVNNERVKIKEEVQTNIQMELF